MSERLKSYHEARWARWKSKLKYAAIPVVTVVATAPFVVLGISADQKTTSLPTPNTPTPTPTETAHKEPGIQVVFRPLFLDGKGGLTYYGKPGQTPFCGEVVPANALPYDGNNQLCSVPQSTVEEFLNAPQSTDNRLKEPIKPPNIRDQRGTVDAWRVFAKKGGGCTLNPNEAIDPNNQTWTLIRWPADPNPPTQAPACLPPQYPPQN
jgi:hypothetical protein